MFKRLAENKSLFDMLCDILFSGKSMLSQGMTMKRT